ncbi:hypothetical protein G9C85_02480 [Halorubellus sp. JP-L1]|uniref:hypothetical protein n=1 Tax=Halorubellus sp. JP-L1 TaxID=2715753 RepID=UPI001407D876|nr:hypothetical protein [Halorubellus sp. JP-L1]NHN40504.1 hypothetical protein [Halorubellus sp. JP-L1]
MSEHSADGAEDESVDGPLWCPWCKAVIAIDGELVTSEGGAYWHAYDHRDKGSHAVTVMEAFEVLDTVETEQHKISPPSSGNSRSVETGAEREAEDV